MRIVQAPREMLSDFDFSRSRICLFQAGPVGNCASEDWWDLGRDAGGPPAWVEQRGKRLQITYVTIGTAMLVPVSGNLFPQEPAHPLCSCSICCPCVLLQGLSSLCKRGSDTLQGTDTRTNVNKKTSCKGLFLTQLLYRDMIYFGYLNAG